MKYFDDYDYKINIDFEFSFKQRKDEKILPWEIASFVNDYNTIYYKSDLLDSISSTLLRGNSPENIIIFDGSLPLNKKYSDLDLINESEAAKYFYKLGNPYSLLPCRRTVEIKLIYSIFSKVNSFLFSKKFKPQVTFFLIEALKILEKYSKERAIDYIINAAVKSSSEHYEKYKDRQKERDPIYYDEIKEILEKTITIGENEIARANEIYSLDDKEINKILTSKNKNYLKKKSDLNKFFEIFKKVNRPVVCLRVGDNKLRVLGRSLVNKTIKGGLQLKSAKKNSPLEALFQGAATAYKTFVETKNQNELHEIEKAIAIERLKQAKFQTATEQIKFEEALKTSSISIEPDIQAIKNLPQSSFKQQVISAYENNKNSAAQLYREHGMSYVEGSFKLLDEKA